METQRVRRHAGKEVSGCVEGSYLVCRVYDTRPLLAKGEGPKYADR